MNAQDPLPEVSGKDLDDLLGLLEWADSEGLTMDDIMGGPTEEGTPPLEKFAKDHNRPELGKDPLQDAEDPAAQFRRMTQDPQRFHEFVTGQIPYETDPTEKPYGADRGVAGQLGVDAAHLAQKATDGILGGGVDMARGAAGIAERAGKSLQAPDEDGEYGLSWIAGVIMEGLGLIAKDTIPESGREARIIGAAALDQIGRGVFGGEYRDYETSKELMGQTDEMASKPAKMLGYGAEGAGTMSTFLAGGGSGLAGKALGAPAKVMGAGSKIAMEATGKLAALAGKSERIAGWMLRNPKKMAWARELISSSVGLGTYDWVRAHGIDLPADVSPEQQAMVGALWGPLFYLSSKGGDKLLRGLRKSGWSLSKATAVGKGLGEGTGFTVGHEAASVMLNQLGITENDLATAAPLLEATYSLAFEDLTPEQRAQKWEQGVAALANYAGTMTALGAHGAMFPSHAPMLRREDPVRWDQSERELFRKKVGVHEQASKVAQASAPKDGEAVDIMPALEDMAVKGGFEAKKRGVVQKPGDRPIKVLEAHGKKGIQTPDGKQLYGKDAIEWMEARRDQAAAANTKARNLLVIEGVTELDIPGVYRIDQKGKHGLLTVDMKSEEVLFRADGSKEWKPTEIEGQRRSGQALEGDEIEVVGQAIELMAEGAKKPETIKLLKDILEWAENAPRSERDRTDQLMAVLVDEVSMMDAVRNPDRFVREFAEELEVGTADTMMRKSNQVLGAVGREKPAGEDVTSHDPKPKAVERTAEGQVNKKQIKEKLEEISGAPIRGGRGGFGKLYLGWYRPSEHAIRQKDAYAIPTSAHEFGHALHKKFIGWKNGFPPEVKRELVARGKALYGELKPAGGYAREGVAEFTSLWLMEGWEGAPKLSELTPKTLEWFDGFMKQNPELAAQLLEAKQLFETYNKQGAESRFEAAFAIEEGNLKARLAKAKEVVSAGKRAFFDRHADIEKAVRKVFEQTGQDYETTPITQNPAEMIRAREGKSYGTLGHMISKETVNARFEATGESLLQIIGDLSPKDRNRVLLLAAARRGKVYYEKKGKNPGFTEADADAYIEKHGESFGERSQRLADWLDRVLDFKVESGALSPEEAAKFRATDPFYIPMFREFADNELARTGRGSKGGYVNQGGHSRSVKGSERRVKDPLSNILEKALDMVSAADKHQVALSFVRMLDSAKGMGKEDGAGHIGHRVSAPIDVTKLKTSEIMEKLAKAGYSIELVEGPGVETMDFFKVRSNENSNKTIVAIKVPRNEEGQVAEIGEPAVATRVEFYDIPNKAVFDILTGVRKQGLAGPVANILRMPPKLIRFGATSGRLAFSLTNLPSDEFTAVLQSKHGISIPGTGTAERLWGLLNPGFRSKQKELIRLASAMGLKSSHLVHQGGEQTADALRRQIDGRMAAYIARVKENPLRAYEAMPKGIQGFFNGVQAIGDFFEATPRLAEMRRAMEKGRELFPDANGGTSLDAMLYAGRAYSEVTLDFSRGGEFAKTWNQYSAFFNVNLIGLEKFSRTWKERPGRTATAWALSQGMPALTLWWLFKDDEIFKDREEWTKFLGFVAPTNDGLLALKGPQGGWNVMNVLTGWFADEVYGNDPGKFDEMMMQAIGEMLPVSRGKFVPDIIKPFIEATSNYSFFTGRYIDNPFEARNRLAKDRYSKTSSETAKAISALLPNSWDLSPRKVEHLVRGYTGGLGIDMIQTVESLPALFSGTLKTELHRAPGISRLYKKPGLYSGLKMRRLFDRLDELSQKAGSKVATPAELAELYVARRIQNGYSDRGAKFGGIKTLKAGVDDGKLDLKTARDIRNNLLKVWEDTAKRLGTWKR